MRTASVLPWTRASPESLALTRETIAAYLSRLEAQGRAKGTIETYRRWLTAAQSLLPDGTITPGALAALRERMLCLGYAPRTVNVCMTALNGLLRATDRPTLQLFDRLDEAKTATPELTRAEYLRLLSAARLLDKRREYLLIKVFATTGVSPQALCDVTVEAAECSAIPSKDGTLSIPGSLCAELLRYAASEGRRAGPIFTDRTGAPLDRTMATHWTQSVADAALVDREKATPRALRKLCKVTKFAIEQEFAKIVDRAYEQLLETEQLSVGWEQNEES